MNLLSLLAVMIYMGPVYIVVIFAIYKWNGYEHILGRYIGRRGQKSIVENIISDIVRDKRMRPCLDRAIGQCQWLVQYIDELSTGQ